MPDVFVPEQTSLPELDRLQRRLVDVFMVWLARRFLDLDDQKTIAVGTGDTRVYHGLRRAARGRIITYQSADARVWDGSASADPASYFNLRADTAVTVRLLVF